MTTTIALITGANKGIGLATARQLGARGMTVLLGARDETRGREAERTLRAEGVDARFVSLDVTDEKSAAAVAELVEREYGHLDVLVNNAGIVRADGTALPSETTLATLREVYETNVFGVVAVTNALLPLLRRAPAARIVNVSSEVGSIAVMTDPRGALFELTSVPYPSSKTALNMITAMYAKELRDTPIRVNAANPGYCATDLNHHSGFRTPEQGAEVSVHLATLPADGPSGLLWGYQMDAGGGYGVLPW
ncbi:MULTISPECIES: SDR family oxidoreductase [Micromonospora]|uniref:SDR family oxidoreductase n=1 Tax=Micromonospora solifontis TaxID=2487138 RepID=A0ABX9WCU2_9ACTN|nr:MULTISPECIES: SDR family oxidoreductase [Micromonospora]NES15190.1 SDR family oxidoreductase [Micromonospora sp. PPF5-17B]NES38144.1 SDR family oxidoreductase [Micromonospora solifontis]NES56525.1 SDR family oxidoreductase [Micromonospora sp. PPF5-6]RNL97001.1 SDR family oxidoreductase [Micromonospora solifontis]